MRRYLLTALLFSPALAFAHQQCAFPADRNLDIDLAGAKAIQVVVNSHDLHLEGTSTGKVLVRGKACASDKDRLNGLTVEQHREGDTLIVELQDNNRGWGWGNNYSDLNVLIQIPSALPVAVKVGSGEADVRNVASLTSTVGSGDLHVHKVAGAFSTAVGSGDVDAEDVGDTEVSAVGSGDVEAKTVRGNVSIGSIGSGEAKLRDVSGSVKVNTVGSGSLDVDSVKGNLTVNSLGSGDVDHRGVTGKVDLPNKNR
ncbi:putative adhesin [Luteibacter rhizovicinus]|uniref:Putative adhesin n=1 Tax=Luteibacter rhizovicinus TaxID=242606 RepID=A0A4R3YN00_9GAMM|nr:DUF4097 family beta strand repeat-containing protein [Luteibacter rhizovicinus]TCV94017.1 putative adhesin [Luteibacter rhizovicinus]